MPAGIFPPSPPGLINPLTGGEIVEVDTGGALAQRTTTQAIANLASGGGATGATGPAGPTGSTGPGGPTGATGPSGGGGGSSLTSTLTARTDVAAGSVVSMANDGSGHGVQTWGPAPNVAGTVSPFGSTIFAPFANEFPVLTMSTTAFIIWATGVGAVACTVSGETITAGSLNSNASLAAVSSNGIPQSPVAATLSASLFVIAYNDVGTNNLNVAACSLSGTTITVGTPVQCDSQSGNATIIAADSTHFILSWVGTDGTGNALAGSVLGTTVTLGASVQLNATVGTFGGISATSLTSTLFVFGYVNSTPELECRAASLLGIVLTLGAVQTNSTPTGYISICTLDATHFAAMGSTEGVSPWYVLAASVSGTTISLGAITKLGGNSNINGGWLRQLGANSFTILGLPAIAPPLCAVSGTTITIPAPSILPVVPAPAAQIQAGNGVSVLSATDFIFVDASNAIYQRISGDVSGPFAHDVPGYWLYSLSGTLGLAVIVNFDGTTSIRVVARTANSASGPIGLTAAGATDGNPLAVVTNGECAGFTGLTSGVAYYANGDGTLTTANTGHYLGKAKNTTTMIVTGVQ